MRLSGALLACGLLGCQLPVMPKNAAPPPAAGATVQEVLVRIDSDTPGAALVRLGDDGGVECVAPCLREVTIQEGAQYELQAPGKLPTAPFAAYSKGDDRIWLAHGGVAPGTKWALATATVVSATLGLGLVVTGGVVNTDSVTDDAPALPLALGISGLALGAVSAVCGALTAVYSDSDHEFMDPALPGLLSNSAWFVPHGAPVSPRWERPTSSTSSSG